MDAASLKSELLLPFMTCIDQISWTDPNHGKSQLKKIRIINTLHLSIIAVMGVNETWQQHLTATALEARGCVEGAICLDYINSSKSHGVQGREECSNNLWITSLWVNIKALCLFFIISQSWALGREASNTWTMSRPNYKLNLNSPIFSLKNYCNHEDQMMASLSVFSQGDGRAFADETTAYTRGEEPIISLNMSLWVVVVITIRAVITGVTVSLTSISWQWFGSLSQAKWDHWRQQ